MAGAPVPPKLMEQMRRILPNGEIHTPYGATEALPVSSIAAREVLQETAARTRQGEGTCVGQALPGVRVRVIEPTEGAITTLAATRECADGEIGEILVQGASVTRHYDKLPEADANSKVTDGEVHWHRMGDMGWLDADGRLWFCGRKAERVRTAEQVLYTDCCEAVFNQHPQVFRSALIDSGNGRPAIVVEPEPGAFPKSAAARRAFVAALKVLGATVACTQGIDRFFFAARFPVDVRHNAKINRLRLAKQFGRVQDFSLTKE
jgi:acyl-CoA synthetase (AMP-forming)/AMP-acid ligase II